jgi:hypothetical protein
MRQPASQRRLETNAEDELRLRFARVRVDNGRVLFTDESTDPNYAEEISKLFVRLDRVAKPGPPAHIKLQGVVKHGSALNIDGTLGLFGPSRYVQLQGELHDFAVPTTNPYVNQYLDWVARTGSLTTKVSYRIDGEHLNAVNQLVIDDLQVVRAGSDDEVERRIGMPLNLLVNLIKNARGEIRLTIPVSGRLDEPTFSLKDAIWSGVKNAVLNVLRAPFRLIGRLITGRDDTIAGLDIDPMRFEPGSVVPSAGMDEHVNRLTEFLREAPYAKVRFTPLLTARDITDLKAQEVAGRVQERQRALHLPSFADAARALFQEQWPDRAMPGTLTAVIAALVEAARPPAEETRRLSEARVQYVQQRLIQSEKIAADRLIVVDTPVVQPDLQPGGVALALEG